MTQEVVNRSFEDKITKLSSLVDDDRDRDRDRHRHHGRSSGPGGHRPPPVVCSLCSRLGHTIGTYYTKERADRVAGNLPAASTSPSRPPAAYMAGTEAADEPAPLVYHQAFLAAATTPSPIIPVQLPIPTKDRVQARALALSQAVAQATRPTD